ncbi:MAG: class I SAM-dependent methyltransferase [Patescibacteria group bacterium]|nr:class I SAM-dependent methyltransferase [Patescibacteria group bacterium]
MERLTLTTKPQKDYELVDSGGEEKLERYGDYLLARPDPQALWPKRLGEGEWQKAAGKFVRTGREGKWEAENLPKEWPVEFGGLTFLIKPTSFKHTGLFPEQLSNWEWVAECLRKSPCSGEINTIPTPPQGDSAPAKILNLFGYTGGATLAAAKAGAEVTHVDASKTAVTWARENAKLSGLENAPIRWIVEDAMTFVQREIKRGNRYDGIIMDPPAFGHGSKDELWKIEEHFVQMVALCAQLLNDTPKFFVMSGYAAGYSPLAFAYNLDPVQKKFGGTIECGDLTIAETAGERLLPCGIFARVAFN